MAPTYEYGDMWSVFDDTDLFLFTANATVRRDGALVMGRGIAKDVAEEFPKLPYKFGAALDAMHTREYCLLIPNDWPDDKRFKVGAFQVKIRWQAKAHLVLIATSTRMLYTLAGVKYPQLRFDLNFPGIGNGGLDPKKVKGIIDCLPSNVHVWRFEDDRPKDSDTRVVKGR